MSLVAVFHRDRGPRLDEYQWKVADFVDPNPNIAFWQNSPKFARFRQSSFWNPVAMASLVSTFHDAAVSPEAWPEALKVLTDAAGVAGAALIISNKRTGNVDQAYVSGLSAGFKSDYIRHYAALDPYSPLLDGSWIKLRVSSGLNVAEKRVVQRFRIGVRGSRYSGSAACRYAESSRGLRYSPADRSRPL
jgi:hypothetical protein